MTEFVQITPEEFEKMAVEIVEEAQKKGIILRILGALAIYIHSNHCLECREKYKTIERLGKDKPIFTDLDLMGYSSQENLIKNFFEMDLKYLPDNYVNALFSSRRNIYIHPAKIFHVDVFYDTLRFSHDVKFGNKPNNRLELDFPTISLEDIVLEKLQIHNINKKDLIDLIVLFLGHELSSKGEKERINKAYISQILSDDWGFWYDATNNLNKVLSLVDNFLNERKLRNDEATMIKNRINELLTAIDSYPKTKNWIKRSKKGISKIWYREVDEI